MEKYDFESLIAAGNATGAYRISSGFDVLLYHTFMLIFGGFNLGLILLLAWCFCWRRSYHPNFLIVFFNFFFALFCQALFTGGYSFCLFVVDIVEHPIITWISSIGGIYGTNLLRITYFMFIIERAIATVKHTNYEKDRSIKVGIVLTIISVSYTHRPLPRNRGFYPFALAVEEPPLSLYHLLIASNIYSARGGCLPRV